MKKLTSIVLAAVTAVLLACAFSACGNPNGSSGGNNNSSQTATYLDGTYIVTRGGARGYTITFTPEGTVSGTGLWNNCSGTYTINGDELSGTLNDGDFSISGTKLDDNHWSITITYNETDDPDYEPETYTITKQQ